MVTISSIQKRGNNVFNLPNRRVFCVERTNVEAWYIKTQPTRRSKRDGSSATFQSAPARGVDAKARDVDAKARDVDAKARDVGANSRVVDAKARVVDAKACGSKPYYKSYYWRGREGENKAVLLIWDNDSVRWMTLDLCSQWFAVNTN